VIQSQSWTRTLVLVLVAAVLPKQTHTALPQRAWLSIPRLGLDHVHVRLRHTAGGALLVRLRSPWLYALQGPRHNPHPAPLEPDFHGDTVYVLPPPSHYAPAIEHFFVQRVTVIAPSDNHLFHHIFIKCTLLIRHCGLSHQINQCVVVIAQHT
jgi:hypothetical protein